MIGDIGVHGADHRDVIDALGDVLENLADFDAALAVFAELEWSWESGTGFTFGAEVFGGERFAGVFGERRFGVEGIDLGGASVHEQVDDPFGFDREMGVARGEGRGCSGVGFDELLIGERGLDERGQAESAHAHAAAAQQFAA